MFKHLLPIALLLLFAACQNQTPKEQPESTMPKVDVHGGELAAQLLEKKQLFLARADSAKIADYDEGLRAIARAGIIQSALTVGDTAINFTLSNQNRQPVELYTLLNEGPVVLTWYRGGWCPYCNITLAFLQEKLPEFDTAGGRLVALTPELPDSSMSTAEKHALGFDVLSDVGNGVARQYGVVFKLTDEVAARYQKGFDLHTYNGDASDELPLAATYVIDTSGVITYAFLDVDYRNRAEPSEVLKAIKNLTGAN